MTRYASHRLAYLLLTLTALFWSGNFVLARAMHASVAPLTLAFVRWSIALLLLLPFGAAPAWRQRALWLPYWRRLLCLALLGVSGFNSLVYWGLQYTAATNGVLLNSFIPLLIVLLGALFFGMRSSTRQMLAVAVSFLGVLLIVAHGDWQRLAALDINRGDAVLFLAMVAWALYTLLLKPLPAALDRVGLLTLLVAIGLVGIAPFFAAELLAGRSTPLNPATLATFAYVGTLPSVAAYYCFNLGVARVGAARAGMFIHLMPMFGALLSVLFLGEQLHGYHLAGIVLILGGVLLATRVAQSAPSESTQA
ncbi:DMT family transporter [Vogesella sp. LIG4]|uniref:DMT family transporter n=1 Tax=Vogesella sp. LIG4 TaxID=1192162 RepID=UPI00081F9BAD|nr:DMT family transporter [Vogesella sp. LIG4]SCK15483.1 Threonine/homoserine efflux transporter RhtA [Vogesella sp. LIG4]